MLLYWESVSQPHNVCILWKVFVLAWHKIAGIWSLTRLVILGGHSRSWWGSVIRRYLSSWYIWRYSNTTRAGPALLRHPNLVSIVSADGLAPWGARPSAYTMLTPTLTLFIKFQWHFIISYNFLYFNRRHFYKSPTKPRKFSRCFDGSSWRDLYAPADSLCSDWCG